MKKHSAFSLVELSLVILTIGIVLIGITAGSRMMNDSRLSTARQLTLSSPVSEMEGLFLWFEPTLPFAFATGTSTFTDVETPTDGTLIGRWNDIKSQFPIKYHVTAAASGNRPTYTANCINSLPCLRFISGSSNYLNSTSISLMGNAANIFIVAKRLAASAETAIISATSNAVANDYDNANSFIAFYEGPSGTYMQAYRAAGLSWANHPGNNVPYIISSTFNGATNTTYLNGTAQASAASTGNFNINRFYLGCRSGINAFYNGYVAEIIIFNRALKVDERKSVERYLSKKWNITIS